MRFTLNYSISRLTCLLIAIVFVDAQTFVDKIAINIHTTLQELINDEDTDGDQKITIEDSRLPNTDRGNKIFWSTTPASRFEITGTYDLSNLLQELKLAEESGQDRAVISAGKIFEPPADRISRMIREYYWDGLTRRIDEEGLVKIRQDEKTTTGSGDRYVYVPANDKLAYRYYNSIARSTQLIHLVRYTQVFNATEPTS